MAAIHFTTIPCKPNTLNRYVESHIFFDEIRPCTGNVVYARLEVIGSFQYVFIQCGDCEEVLKYRGDGKTLWGQI